MTNEEIDKFWATLDMPKFTETVNKLLMIAVAQPTPGHASMALIMTWVGVCDAAGMDKETVFRMFDEVPAALKQAWEQVNEPGATRETVANPAAGPGTA